MLIRILSGPIVVDPLAATRRAGQPATPATPMPAAPAASGDSTVTLGSSLTPTLQSWEKQMQQYRQAAAGIARSARSSRRQALTQQAQQLKQRIKALQQMLVMATPQNARVFSRMLAQMARELQQLARALKGLSDGETAGSPQQWSVTVAAVGVDTGIAADGSTAATPDSTAGNAAAAPTPPAADPAGAGGSSAGAAQPAGNGRPTPGDDDERRSDNALADQLKELTAKLKAMRRWLLVIGHDKPVRKDLQHAGEDLDDTGKALAALPDLPSAAPGADSTMA